MPLNIVIGLVALLVALIAYSVAVWAGFRAKTYKTWHVVALWVGVAFDVLATTMMALQIGGLGQDLHTVLALTAWAGMTAVAVSATWYLVRPNRTGLRLLTRLAVAPWVLWVVVLVYGMVERGAARMGG